MVYCMCLAWNRYLRHIIKEQNNRQVYFGVCVSVLNPLKTVAIMVTLVNFVRHFNIMELSQGRHTDWGLKCSWKASRLIRVYWQNNQPIWQLNLSKSGFVICSSWNPRGSMHGLLNVYGLFKNECTILGGCIYVFVSVHCSGEMVDIFQ